MPEATADAKPRVRRHDLSALFPDMSQLILNPRSISQPQTFQPQCSCEIPSKGMGRALHAWPASVRSCGLCGPSPCVNHWPPNAPPPAAVPPAPSASVRFCTPFCPQAWDTVTDGDTILLRPGTYSETFLLTHDVDIQGLPCTSCRARPSLQSSGSVIQSFALAASVDAYVPCNERHATAGARPIRTAAVLHCASKGGGGLFDAACGASRFAGFPPPLPPAALPVEVRIPRGDFHVCNAFGGHHGMCVSPRTYSR